MYIYIYTIYVWLDVECLGEAMPTFGTSTCWSKSWDRSWTMPRHSEERGKENTQRKQQTYEPLWRFTWVKTHVQRCEGQRAHRFAKRCGRYVEKTGADGVGWFLWFPFFLNLIEFLCKFPRN